MSKILILPDFSKSHTIDDFYNNKKYGVLNSPLSLSKNWVDPKRPKSSPPFFSQKKVPSGGDLTWKQRNPRI